MRNLCSVLCLIILMSFGCGEKTSLKVVPVSGKLLLKKDDGTQIPMPGAKLVLTPMIDANKFQGYPSAKTEADGTFKLGTYSADDGAPEGEYVVAIEWKNQIRPKKDILGRGEIDNGPDKLKGLYSDAAKSPLRAKVVAGQELLIVVPSS